MLKLLLKKNWFHEVNWVSYWDTGVSVSFQLTFTCPKSTIETLENGAKYVQSQQ